MKKLNNSGVIDVILAYVFLVGIVVPIGHSLVTGDFKKPNFHKEHTIDTQDNLGPDQDHLGGEA